MLYSSQMRNTMAKDAYRSFLRKRGVFGFSLNVKDLKVFKEIQKESKAFNNSFMGIKNVPLDKVVGSVEKYKDFDEKFIPKNSIIEERWCRIYTEVMGDANLPPVNLYKIRDEYYVYDGNHRISVAKFMNFKMIEAEVTEFFPSGDSEEDVILKERFAFEKELGLEGIIVTKTGGYKRLRRSIEDYRIDSKKDSNEDFGVLVRDWYEALYKPIKRILINNGLVKDADGDVFLAFLDHKYYLSEYRKHNVGYAYSLIDFINYMKIGYSTDRISNLKVDRNFTSSFRDLYSLDKMNFYRDDFHYKLRRISEFSNRKFARRSHILGEIFLYKKKNNIEDYEMALKEWFTNVYAEYFEMFLDKSGVLGGRNIFSEDRDVVEDIIRYSREYRRKLGTHIEMAEILLRYMIDIYLPTMSLLDGKSGEESKKQYFEISHRYMYYLRYGGEEKLIEFEKKYIEGEGSSNFLLDTLNIKNPKGDMFRDIKKLIIYYAPTKAQGEMMVEEFYSLIDEYGGTYNYSIIKNLKESLILTADEDVNINWVKDVLQKDLEKLVKNKEVLINYNTKRVSQLVKGVWSSYSIIDYYATIIPLDLKRRDKCIVDVAREYMKNDFRY